MDSAYYDGVWQELANAVIVSAADDYRSALKKKLRTRNQTLIDTCDAIMEEVVEFFHSDWFRILTNADPEKILDGLRTDVMEGENYDESEGSVPVPEFSDQDGRRCGLPPVER